MVDAKHYLRQVEMLDARIKNKLIEQQQWKDIALGITASIGGERVQSTGSQQKMADAINKCVDMEAEIDGLIDTLISTKRDVIATIEQLDSPTEYNVLHKRFIQYLSLQDIADECGKDYGWAKTVNGRGIANVRKILEKRHENG
jgi:hypothetical protein